MTTVTFYEKPGCQGNAKQKALLQAAGHEVIAKNLKAEAWTAEGLLAFLSPLPVTAWFNPAAPQVKVGQIKPENLTREEAMPLLLENPLLIRRPLLEAAGQRLVGFDTAAVDAWIGLKGVALPEGNIEACVHGPEGHTCGGHDDEHHGEGDDHGGCGQH